MQNAVGETKDPQKIVSALKALSQQKAFKKHCESSAMTMVTQLYKKNNIGWRQAALTNGKGKNIYNAIMREIKSGMVGNILNEQIAINAAYIKTFPIDIATELTDRIEYETFKGLRASEIAEGIQQEFPLKAKSRIELIARTEVSKTQCALVQARAENLGLNWYIWRTSHDERVRSSHDFMEGVLVRWSDPPSPEALAIAYGSKKGKGKPERPYGKYHAGNTFNCRCYSEPVIDITDITFPCKVYYNGNIVKMKKSDFEKIA